MDLPLLLIHLMVLVLVFALAYWTVSLVCAVLPPPTQARVSAILYVLLALIAIGMLLGEVGWWGTWGIGYGPPRHHL